MKTIDDYVEINGKWYINERYWLGQIHQADIESSVARQFGEDDSAYRWQSYGEFCQRKLRILRANQQKVTNYDGGLSVKEIKQKHDIFEVISRYTTLRGRGDQFYGKCPLHNDDRASLGVNSHKQTFHCFGCQAGGDVIQFIRLIENTDVKGACKLLDV